MLLGTIVSFTSILLELSFASPFYSMQPAHIVANIGTTGRNIRHLPCISRKSNQKGVCMFAIDCLKSNGTHLGTCIDRFYFGSCCRIDHVNEIASNTIDAALIPPDRHHQHTHIQTSTTTETATTYHKNVSSSTTKTKIETSTTAKPTLITKVPISTQKTKSPSITTTTARTKYSTTVKPQRTTTPKQTTKYTITSTKSTATTTTEKGTTTLFYGDKIVTTIRPKSPNSTQFSKIKLTTKPPKIETTTNFPERLTTFQNVVENTVSYETTSQSSTATSKLSTTPKPTRPKPTTSKPFPTKKPSAYPTFTKPKPTTAPSKPTASKPTRTSPKPYVSTTSKPLSAVTQKPVKIPPRPLSTTKKPVTSTSKPVITSSAKPSSSSTTSSSSSSTTTAKKPVVTSTSSTITTTSSTTITVASKLPVSTDSITNLTGATLNASTSTQLPVNYPDYTTVILLTTTEKLPSASTDSNEVSVQLNGTASEPLVTGNVDTNEIQQEKPLKPLTPATATPEQPEQTTTQPFVTWTIPEENASNINQTDQGWKPITSPDWVLLPSVSTSSPAEINVTSSAATISSEIPDVSTIPENTTTSTTFTNFTETSPLSSSTSTPKPVSSDLPVDFKPVNMSDFTDVCGRRMYPEARIVGGERSAFGRWPWQVSLRQWRTSTYLHKCGAALLNENWAITAAHCVDNVPPSDLLLRFGEHDLSTESEPHIHQERRVQIVASHPEFDPRTFEYDLALLRFYEPLEFQPNIIPVCVPQTDQDFVGRTAYVTGWGRLYEDGPLPSVLQEVSVPVINNSVCESMYRSAGYIEHIPHIFICAGWRKGGFDSCEGDSGGPMVIQRPEDKRFVLAGIISWGIGCAEPNQPGVYTRISEFKDWINQILQF
ncbi:serine proteinase stubble [Agrilus planipennis]|uniref:Serine proteinase stubble n=1 Tax=Agrilus planipennis TaxID=224129 RepID=A0A7F5RMJ4_AGRPL|nr:serine proteinase stubble [Agrilus planipennis]